MDKLKCSKCGREKIVSEFSKNNNRKRRYHAYCKICQSVAHKKWRRTKYGVLKCIYNTQREHSKRSDYLPPQYSFEQLKNWALSQPIFHELFNDWRKLNYDKWSKPSCDRLYNNIGYYLSNLQIVTWGDNQNNAYRDMRGGIIKGNKPHKKVIQLTTDGVFIAEFISLHEAERSTNISHSNIAAVCLGRKNHKTAGGFNWKYKNN